MGRITERDIRNEPRFNKDTSYQSAKFGIQIQAVFKKTHDSASTTVRKIVPLLISAKDLECRCPKLRANRQVFIAYLAYFYLITISMKSFILQLIKCYVCKLALIIFVSISSIYK